MVKSKLVSEKVAIYQNNFLMFFANDFLSTYINSYQILNVSCFRTKGILKEGNGQQFCILGEAKEKSNRFDQSSLGGH